MAGSRPIAKLLPWLFLNAANITYDVASHLQLFYISCRAGPSMVIYPPLIYPFYNSICTEYGTKPDREPPNLPLKTTTSKLNAMAMDACTSGCTRLLRTGGIYGDGIHDAITLGNSSMVVSRDECIWRRGGDRDPCPDPDIKYYFYGNGKQTIGEEIPPGENSQSWVRESRHDPTKDTVVLIHGYAGISDELPMGVLRDAYLTNGSYNVYTVDWSPLARVPCYAAAVHNMRPVAKCLASFLTFLRDAGVDPARTTCIGHSLGAHVCGVASNYLYFRMHKIIGLDPARPLIRSQLTGRLDPGDAKVVQVIHTSSTFGDARRSGHVDFCINGARVQPFCANTTNESLCSHIRSVCYLAESLDGNRARIGAPCLRRCLTGAIRPSWDRRGLPVPLGHKTPDWVDGLYCISNEDAPYCPSEEHPIGSPLCCVPPKPLISSNLV